MFCTYKTSKLVSSTIFFRNHQIECLSNVKMNEKGVFTQNFVIRIRDSFIVYLQPVGAADIFPMKFWPYEMCRSVENFSFHIVSQLVRQGAVEFIVQGSDLSIPKIPHHLLKPIEYYFFFGIHPSSFPPSTSTMYYQSYYHFYRWPPC